MSEIMTVARPYATAVFESALAKNVIKEWASALKKLALIAMDPKMQTILTNPLISKEKLTEVMVDLGGECLNEGCKRLISLLAEKRRLQLLPAIEDIYEKLVAERERTIDVKVVSAHPIDQNRLQRLQHSLQDKFKRQVNIQCLIDKTLLGGAVIYAGDQVIDGSLRNKLNRLSERLCC